MATLLSKKLDRLIDAFSDEDRTTAYERTSIGNKILLLEMQRIEELYANIQRYKEADE